MHVLNVSFHIMPEILFRNIIGVNYILYIDTDSILKARDVLIYPAVMILDIIYTIIQAYPPHVQHMVRLSHY